MNDMIISKNVQSAFPAMAQGLQRAINMMDGIKSFEDIERVFLKGAGLSPNTYRSYMEAVKQFYTFTQGKHPLQVTAGDIEAFYDDLVKRVDRNTAYLRIRGLKRFYKGVQKMIPFCESPFTDMDKKLTDKLNKTKHGNRTKPALTKDELNNVLQHLSMDTTEEGRANYAAFFMLCTSGLRGSELTSLTWGSIDKRHDGIYAYFTGKGDTQAEQELYGPALEACRVYFRATFNREPAAADHLFYTVPRYNGDTRRPLTYHTLWERFKRMGVQLQAAGLISKKTVFSPHLCRRTYATGLYNSGMKIKAVKEKTRHASIDTLINHYIVDREPAAAYLEKLLN